jgi:hypothetical protein
MRYLALVPIALMFAHPAVAAQDGKAVLGIPEKPGDPSATCYDTEIVAREAPRGVMHMAMCVPEADSVLKAMPASAPCTKVVGLMWTYYSYGLQTAVTCEAPGYAAGVEYIVLNDSVTVPGKRLERITPDLCIGDMYRIILACRKAQG